MVKCRRCNRGRSFYQLKLAALLIGKSSSRNKISPGSLAQVPFLFIPCNYQRHTGKEHKMELVTPNYTPNQKQQYTFDFLEPQQETNACQDFS